MAVRETYNCNIVVAHLNHGWRATSDHDERFCQELARQFGLPFFGKHARESIGSVPWTGSLTDGNQPILSSWLPGLQLVKQLLH